MSSRIVFWRPPLPLVQRLRPGLRGASGTERGDGEEAVGGQLRAAGHRVGLTGPSRRSSLQSPPFYNFFFCFRWLWTSKRRQVLCKSYGNVKSRELMINPSVLVLSDWSWTKTTQPYDTWTQILFRLYFCEKTGKKAARCTVTLKQTDRSMQGTRPAFISSISSFFCSISCKSHDFGASVQSELQGILVLRNISVSLSRAFRWNGVHAFRERPF